MKKFKRLLRRLLPDFILTIIMNTREFIWWKNRGFLENSPQFIKQKIFLKYAIPNAQWVETGTYRGITTKFLSENYNTIYSVEPGLALFESVSQKLKCEIQKKNFNNIKWAENANKKIYLYNALSEDVFPALLPTLNGDCNFWLDGHYSGGDTFKGPVECPVVGELLSIKKNLLNFRKVAILIDDIRCFLPKYKKKRLPKYKLFG
jgi:hypothetical protein